MKKVLICGAPDLNYIDGSSIWAQTISLAFSATKACKVDFILKSEPQRDELFTPLYKDKNINLIHAYKPELWNGKKLNRLSFEQLAQIVGELDQLDNYDVIIIRGFEIAKELLKNRDTFSRVWVYLTDIPQKIDLITSEDMVSLKTIASNASRVLYQSSGFLDLWRKILPTLDETKCHLYSPVIEDFRKPDVGVNSRSNQAIYAGKFVDKWHTLEMLSVWPKVIEQCPGANLIALGDKISNSTIIADYKEKMEHLLTNTKRVDWLGGQSRKDVFSYLRKSKVGLSWRDESLNDTLEYSTKILEYGAAGCAAIINRNSMHEHLLGKDYPLFANSIDEFEKSLILALTDDDVLEEAASKLCSLSSKHTFSQRVNDIKAWLGEVSPLPVLKECIVVAGHDFKFFQSLIKSINDTGKYYILIDKWDGHNKHDVKKSSLLLEKANIILCEWCLGNLQWYSKHKKSNQKLIARCHGQERKLPYLSNTQFKSVSHIGFVSNWLKNEVETNYNLKSTDTSVIPNFLDETKFTLRKKTGDACYTLGMIGIVPSMKRLDRAIDLLEILLKQDLRYQLRVKGKHPLDFPWMLNKPNEISFYKKVFERINSSPLLRYKVIFDPAGDDVNDWLTMVGYILSPSDFESFHMAVGEGMLTGSTPIIWDWEGADDIWFNTYILSDVEPLKIDMDKFQRISPETVRNQVLSRYSSKTVLGRWLSLLES